MPTGQSDGTVYQWRPPLPKCASSCVKVTNLTVIQVSVKFVFESTAHPVAFLTSCHASSSSSPPCLPRQEELYTPDDRAPVCPLTLQVFKEEHYLCDAQQCADVIWQYGLLKKGYGLCHGAAGNAYAFLALYNLTQDAKYLYRACKVRARLCTGSIPLGG